MEPYHIFLVILALFISMLIGISLLTSRRQKSVTDFWLAGRELGAGIIGLSTAASWINAKNQEYPCVDSARAHGD
jgi:SSS family solute:Na+ symporter